MEALFEIPNGNLISDCVKLHLLGSDIVLKTVTPSVSSAGSGLTECGVVSLPTSHHPVQH